MEELLFLALLGTQIVLILILIVIAQRCHSTLVGIGNALRSARNTLEDSEGRVNVAKELRGIHKQLRDIEYHTRKPPSAIAEAAEI